MEGVDALKGPISMDKLVKTYEYVLFDSTNILLPFGGEDLERHELLDQERYKFFSFSLEDCIKDNEVYLPRVAYEEIMNFKTSFKHKRNSQKDYSIRLMGIFADQDKIMDYNGLSQKNKAYYEQISRFYSPRAPFCEMEDKEKEIAFLASALYFGNYSKNKKSACVVSRNETLQKSFKEINSQSRGKIDVDVYDNEGKTFFLT